MSTRPLGGAEGGEDVGLHLKSVFLQRPLTWRWEETVGRGPVH